MLQRMNYFSTGFICLFLWQEVIKRYLKISRNRAVTRARQKSYKEKNTALRRKEKEQKTKCYKMNNKKKKNWDFHEIKVKKSLIFITDCTAEGFPEKSSWMKLSKNVFRIQ